MTEQVFQLGDFAECRGRICIWESVTSDLGVSKIASRALKGDIVVILDVSKRNIQKHNYYAVFHLRTFSFGLVHADLIDPIRE
jgi:hypothetical protein